MAEEAKTPDPDEVREEGETPAAGTPAAAGEDLRDGLVLLTGATGLVGSAVLRGLVESGLEVRALIAPGESAREVSGASTVTADLRAPESLPAALEGVRVVVSAAQIAREDRSAGRTFSAVYVEGTRNLAAAAKAAGVSRLVHVSAVGATDTAPSAGLRARATAEHAVRGSGLEHVIVRSGILFGAGTLLERVLARWAGARAPVTLMPGQADMVLQPLSVADLAEAAARAARGMIALGSHDLAGGERLTLMDMVDATLAAARRRPVRLHVPMCLLSAAGSALDHLPTGALPDSAELAHLRSPWVARARRASELLGREPAKVSEWIARAFGRGAT